jgi:hypothetical protein
MKNNPTAKFLLALAVVTLTLAVFSRTANAGNRAVRPTPPAPTGSSKGVAVSLP